MLTGITGANARGKNLRRQQRQRPKPDRLTPKALALAAQGRSYSQIERGGELSKNTVAGIVKRSRTTLTTINGGSAEPARALDRTPRLADRLRALTGDPDARTVRASLEALAVPPAANRIECPLLLLHGGADALFPPAEALPLAEHAPSRDKTVLFWDDGDHCIYNHSHEKHCAIADWFADRLSPTTRHP